MRLLNATLTNISQDPEESSKAHVGHQAFIETLARVRTELGSHPVTLQTSSSTPASSTLRLQGLSLVREASESLDEAIPESLLKGAEKEITAARQSLQDDKVQARFALQDIFSTLKSLEQEALSLWEAFHNDQSESQLVIAATTTYMATKLATALEVEFNELYKNCNISSLAQELHAEACKEKGQPNLHDFVIDFDHYTTAESYYIPHLWMATLLYSNWKQVVQDVERKKAVSRSFDQDERQLFESPDSGPFNDEGKENKARCEESLKFGYRRLHRLISSLSMIENIEGFYDEFYPVSMEPLVQMIAEQHKRPLAFAFALRLEEKITLMVGAEPITVCETANRKMLAVVNTRLNHLSLNEEEFKRVDIEGHNYSRLWEKLQKLLDELAKLLKIIQRKVRIIIEFLNKPARLGRKTH